MKTQSWVYAVVALLSLAAGLAIAGLPNPVPTDPTIDVPVSAAPAPAPVDTVDDATETDPDEAGDASAGDADDAEVAGDPIDATTTSTSTTTTTTTSTTVVDDPVSDTSEPDDPFAPSTPTATDRETTRIVVANGASRSGVAGDTADFLVESGYPRPPLFDGDVDAESTEIFVFPGFEPWALRLADDIGIEPDRVRPLDEAPDASGVVDEPILVYLGRDVVSIPSLNP